jgi:hypothetical protein
LFTGKRSEKIGGEQVAGKFFDAEPSKKKAGD